MADLARIRIGTDVTVALHVSVSGKPVTWSDDNIRHIYAFSDVQGQPVAEMTHRAEGEALVCTFAGADQNYTGAYRIIVEFGGMASSIDVPAFELVRTSAEADADTGEVVLDYDGTMRFYSLGTAVSILTDATKNADDAANAATDAAGSAETAADKATAAASRAEEVSEELRKAEKVRETAESERKTAENARKSAEMERNEAELERKASETARASEFAKMKEESEAATKNAQAAADRAESAAIITGIDIDGEKGVITITAETGTN